MKNNNRSVAEIVNDIIADTAATQGLEVWDIEYVREGADNILRITIDKDGGVDIDDCEKFHRAIDPLLDEADPIEASYYLQVCSPGVERELRTPAHILRYLGCKVDVKLYAPQNGRKAITGIITDFDGKTLTLDENGETDAFPYDKIVKISLNYDF